MHMAFLSREFKNLQWYGMTKKNPQKCGFFLYSCGFSAFLVFANIAVSCGLFACRLHRNYTVKYPLRNWRGDCCV